MKTIGIIPARLQSQRLPNKLIELLGDKTVLQRVWENARMCSSLDKLIIATDSIEIKDVALTFGAEVMLTSTTHRSGTDRIFEAYTLLNETYDIIINIQGDEPFIDSTVLDSLIEAHKHGSYDVVTPVCSINHFSDLISPSIVKVVKDSSDNALYFSRSPIPFIRDIPIEQWLKNTSYWKHIGLYAYTNAALKAFTELLPGKLELLENLEQLRLLEENYVYHCIEIPQLLGPGIDTHEDLLMAKNILGIS